MHLTESRKQAHWLRSPLTFISNATLPPALIGQVCVHSVSEWQIGKDTGWEKGFQGNMLQSICACSQEKGEDVYRSNFHCQIGICRQGLQFK
jgi:hypothetical protein